MFYPYPSGYHISSSPSFPGAWSSAWSLPQQYEAEIKRVDDNHQSLSPDPVDLDRPEPTNTSIHKPVSKSKTGPPGALFTSCQQEIPYLSLSQSSLTSSQDDAISDSNTLPEYSRPYSPKLTALASESNSSLDTVSLFSANSFMNSPNSTLSQKFSSEINQDTSHSHRKSTETAPPNFDNNALGNHDTFLDHIPRVSNTGRDYSPEFYPYPLLLSEPDGNTWTLSLDPTNSHLISRSSLELESQSSDHDDEVIASTRVNFPSVPFTPKYNGSFLSLPRSQVGVHDIAKYTAASDVSMIVSSSSSVQQRHGKGTISSTGKADLYSNDLLHDFPLSTAQDNVLDPQQRSRSKKLIKTSKNVFDRLKKLFTPKGTISENVHHPPKSDFVAANPRASGRRFFSSYQRNKLTKSAQFSTPSLEQSFSPGDTSLVDVNEKYTYEYHARPKTLKEIKSQRRFSLPMAFVGTSSRVTPPTKRNITTSVSQSRSRPMSTYIASQNETLDFAT